MELRITQTAEVNNLKRCVETIGSLDAPEKSARSLVLELQHHWKIMMPVLTRMCFCIPASPALNGWRIVT